MRRKSRRKWAWIIGSVVVVLALVAGGLVAWQKQVFVAVPSRADPDRTDLEAARAATAKDHFTLHVDKGVQSVTVAVGVILTQSPKPGKVLKEGSTLSVVPSLGPPAVAVPSLTGMTCGQAVTTLKAAHLQGDCVDGPVQRHSPERSPHLVVL